MSRLVWLIPLFPLVGALVNALFGRRTGHLAHAVAVPALGLAFLTSCFVFAHALRGETYVGQLFPWVSAGAFQTAVANITSTMNICSIRTAQGEACET